MDTTILRVPIDKEILAQAKKRAKEMGFNSIQSLVRYFLKLTAERKIDIKVLVRQ